MNIFNNIIYFIIVLLLFNLHNPDQGLENTSGYDLIMLVVCWVLFASFCRFCFHRLIDRIQRTEGGNGRLSRDYQSLVVRLSVLAIGLFALDVYLFDLKAWIQAVPGFRMFSALQGVFALALFFFYLGTIWTIAHPAYEGVFKTKIPRHGFVLSNIKLNIPIIFPWLALSLIYDLISLSPWSGLETLMNRPEGQIPFFAVFLVVLMIFMPRIIRTWWGCKPFDQSEKIRELDAFLHSSGLKYRSILKWPIFEGRIMTAGIMGIIPRYRYILVTDALMDILSMEELKAVLAHEAGHVKYGHMIFYIIFFLGYMILSFGLFDIFRYFLMAQPPFLTVSGGNESQMRNLFYLAWALPVLASILLYFRFVMGFFMRHFERQADLYSAVVMGGARQTISSLEKIALLSGKIRDLPSWHHFSIKQRVGYLWRSLKEPGLIKRYNRFVVLALTVYFICLLGLGYLVNLSPMKDRFADHYLTRALSEQLTIEPTNPLLYQNLAMVYHRMGKYREAMEAYEKLISLDPTNALALNNLAWLMVTTPEEELKDRVRALALAKEAVTLERSPMFLDTLAEAYYANGLIPEAIETIREAISLAKENQGYYRRQLKKFSEGPRL